LDNSPESCSDWIPASWNSPKSCTAFIYTDLGFISRVRPKPDFEASERYYNSALQISPGMCGATAYLAELRVQQGNQANADKMYAKACTACGAYSMDFTDLHFAYEQRNWKAPSCGKTSTTKSAVKSVVVVSTPSPPSSSSVSAHYTSVEELPPSITPVQLFASSTYKSAKREGLGQALQLPASKITISGFEIGGSSGGRRLSSRRLATSGVSVKTNFKVQVADAAAASAMSASIAKAGPSIKLQTDAAMAKADWSKDSVIAAPPTMATPTIQVQALGKTTPPTTGAAGPALSTESSVSGTQSLMRFSTASMMSVLLIVAASYRYTSL